jgi:hypothetical protein
MVRKKARIKASQSWPCCWRRIGCEFSVGLLFFLSSTLAISFFIYLVVTVSVQPLWQFGVGQCQHEQTVKSGPAERTESYRPAKPDKQKLPDDAELWKPGFMLHRYDNDEPEGAEFYKLADEKWVNFMHSLGLVSTLENGKNTSRKIDSHGHAELMISCKEKCLSSSEISPFRQWMLFFRALAMFKMFWDKQVRVNPPCEFIMNMDKTPTFYTYSRTLLIYDAANHDDKQHIKFNSMECKVNINGTMWKAGLVFDAVLDDVFMRRLLSAEELRVRIKLL